MMNKIGKLITAVSILTMAMAGQTQAQQYPLRYMYDQYRYTVNPAALKIGEGVGIHTAFGNDWYNEASNNTFYGLGVEGGFFYGKMGLGLILSQENIGLLRHSNVKLAYAYRVRLKAEHWLTFGISAGFGYTGQHTSDIITGDYSDPLIGESQKGFLGSFGLNYHWNNLDIDAAIPSYNSINKAHVPVFLSASYRFKLAEDWGLKPALMYSGLNPNIQLLDIRLQALFKDYVWIQAGYRTSNECVFAAGGSYKNVSLSAAFGFTTSDYSELNKGNLELILGYRFSNATIKKSNREQRKQTQESISRISTDMNALKSSDDKQARELEKINAAIVSLNNELQSELKDNLNEIKESVQSIRREELEVDENKIIDKQYFVVVFSTKTRDDADRIVQRMARQNVKGQIIKDSQKSFFYIYTETFDNLNAAMEQSSKEKERGFSSAWVLIVK
jgi:type IX secretion system PorP/SprF family membrane protein